MKRLKIPTLDALDVLDITSVGPILETMAPREFIACANWERYPYKPIAAFNIARTKNNLYLRFCVQGNSLKASYDVDGSPVHEDSCVEFFVRHDCDPAYYTNFEFNCIGTCDAAFRKSRTEKRPFTPEEYRQVKRLSSIKGGAFEEKHGFFGWTLIAIIPFSLMGLNPQRLPKKIYGNFYKCGDKTGYPHFLSWSPIDLPEPDFHCPQFFGEIYL